MKALKPIFVALVIVATMFLVAVKFSAVDYRFECSGNLVLTQNSRPETIYLKLQKYRWWVRFWSNSKGALWAEVPNEASEYYSQLSEAGDLLQIYKGPNKFNGNFSSLSKALTLEIPFHGTFSGTCKPIR
jgi:hypothetical protein